MFAERLFLYKSVQLWHYNFMSIRLRLTLWYTSMLAIMLLLFGGALYSLLTFTLLNTIDRQLETTARRVTQSVRLRLSYGTLDTIVEIAGLDILIGSGLYVQAYDGDARQIVQRSSTLGEASLPLETPVLQAALRGQSQYETRSVGGTRLRIYTAPVVIDGQMEGVIQVAAAVGQVYQTQRQLLIILVSGGVIGVAISALLGALLARAALRPIDSITQTALAISRTEDLSRRLEVEGPPDEVGRLSSTFNEMLARLETLFKTQRRFTADVSHELRTPLTTIRGNIDLLRRGAAEDEEARRQTMAAVESEVDRMSRLVADLLLLAQADAGVRLDSQPVELDTLLLAVYRQARTMSQGAEVRLGHEDQAIILGDADRLKQLLLNLVDNALKYTPAGGRVTLSLYRTDGWVRLLVSDTGSGIQAEHLQPGPTGLPLIFERFYRADKARSRAMGGTGLGLSIAYWIAQAHGGRIQVESEVGRGTTFTVWLPEERLNVDTFER